MKKSFWEVIYDDSLSKMEILGTSTDDTHLIYNVSEMQRAGMKVRCQTPPISTPKEDIIVKGYEIEENLYARLLIEYEKLTRKQLKRW